MDAYDARYYADTGLKIDGWKADHIRAQQRALADRLAADRSRAADDCARAWAERCARLEAPTQPAVLHVEDLPRQVQLSELPAPTAPMATKPAPAPACDCAAATAGRIAEVLLRYIAVAAAAMPLMTLVVLLTACGGGDASDDEIAEADAAAASATLQPVTCGRPCAK